MDSDKMLIDLLVELKKVFIVVLTKSDKVKSPSHLEKQVQETNNFIQASGGLSVPIIHAVSALNS